MNIIERAALFSFAALFFGTTVSAQWPYGGYPIKSHSIEYAPHVAYSSDWWQSGESCACEVTIHGSHTFGNVRVLPSQPTPTYNRLYQAPTYSDGTTNAILREVTLLKEEVRRLREQLERERSAQDRSET